MLIATVMVMLQTAPAAWLTYGAPREVRLIADEAAPQRDYAHMTREEQRAICQGLQKQRPGMALPVLLWSGGGAGAFITGVLFWIPFSTPYGLPVYLAAILITAFVVSLLAVGTGVFIYARNKPERDELGRELQLLEEHEREGRCLSVPGARPCRNDPRGPPGPQERRPNFVPQVRAPDAPEPSLVLAIF